jgi:hypothetical protein
MNPATDAIASNEHASADRGSHDGKGGNASSPVKTVLTDAMLARFASRAASYDRRTAFSRRTSRTFGTRAICFCRYLRNSGAWA